MNGADTEIMADVLYVYAAHTSLVLVHFALILFPGSVILDPTTTKYASVPSDTWSWEAAVHLHTLPVDPENDSTLLQGNDDAKLVTAVRA